MLGAGPVTSREKDLRDANTFQALASIATNEEDRSTHFVVSPRSPALEMQSRTDPCIGAVQSSCHVTEQSSLLFSHLERTTHGEVADGGTRCNCEQWNRSTSCYTVDTTGSASAVCHVCGCSRVANQNSDESIITSFNSLSVSHSGYHGSSNTLRTLPHSGSSTSMSCRQQAVTYGAGGRCYDDTTVDDLAGYLDEIMFLPKPMSEMAELMYT